MNNVRESAPNLYMYVVGCIFSILLYTRIINHQII